MNTKPTENTGNEKTSHKRINLFRQVSIETEDGRQNLLQWRTTKAQELFLYLLQHRGKWVRKSLLTEMFWPEYEQDKVYSQLYTAIYHIRKTLKPFGDRVQIVNAADGYMMNLEQIPLDIEEWEMKLPALPPISEESIEDYIEVMKLYTGDYLQEYDYWWAESERQRLRNLWLKASYSIGEWYVGQEEWEKAISIYDNLCELHPQEEEPYFALMKIYASLHNPPMVEKYYLALTTVLQLELNVILPGRITDWYEEWTKSLESELHF